MYQRGFTPKEIGTTRVAPAASAREAQHIIRTNSLINDVRADLPRAPVRTPFTAHPTNVMPPPAELSKARAGLVSAAEGGPIANRAVATFGKGSITPRGVSRVVAPAATRGAEVAARLRALRAGAGKALAAVV